MPLLEVIMIASMYWQGTHVACHGARFDPNGLTAAHKSLPCGTRLQVTNPKTGASITVTINDRGPFTKGRDIDLSLGAANAIGFSGVGPVRVRGAN